MRIKEFTIPPKAVPVEQKVAALQKIISLGTALREKMAADLQQKKAEDAVK